MDARIHAAALALTASLSLPALADGSDQPASSGASAAHRLGDYPAVIVARLEKVKGYDYAAKFNPHPARLEVIETPPPLGDHPAVVVARMQKDKGYDYAAQFYPHPAWLAMLPKAPPEASTPVVAATKAPKKVSGRSGAAAAASAAPAAIAGTAETDATAVAATERRRATELPLAREPAQEAAMAIYRE